MSVREMRTLEQAYLSICTTGLTDQEVEMLDEGRTNRRIDEYTRTASKMFLMSVHWALFHFARPVAEADTDDLTEIARRYLALHEETRGDLDKLMQRLGESVVQHPIGH